jgi:hypothetical protein
VTEFSEIIEDFRQMIIYKIQNKINGKIYIGQTKYPLSKRIGEHLAEKKSFVQKALNKYGLQSFDISIIDSAETREILSDKEIYWIRFYNCKAPKGYNCTDGGDGLVNPSQIIKDRISNKLKGHSSTIGFTGKKHSQDSKHKISESLKIAMADPSVKTKMSISRKGRRISEEQKEKISKANKGKLKGRIPWNKGFKASSVPGYVNSMKGKKRPDLSARNKLGRQKNNSL